MFQTTGAQCPIQSPTFNTLSYQAYASKFQGEFITIGLLGGLYGMRFPQSETSLITDRLNHATRRAYDPIHHVGLCTPGTVRLLSSSKHFILVLQRPVGGYSLPQSS